MSVMVPDATTQSVTQGPVLDYATCAGLPVESASGFELGGVRACRAPRYAPDGAGSVAFDAGPCAL
jgi:hypothetical protein